MKFVGQGVQKLEPEQLDTHTYRQTQATENITFPLTRLVMNNYTDKYKRFKFFTNINVVK